MSNLATLFGARFVIRPDRVADCLAAVQPPASLGERLSRLAPGATQRALADAFERVHWRLRFDARGGVEGVEFVGQNLRGDDLFERAAPFVEPGSYVDFRQSYAGGTGDQPNTRWAFDGSRMAWVDLVPPEERKAMEERERAWRNRDLDALREVERQNRARLERGEPLVCATCVAYRRGSHPMVPCEHPMPRERPVILAKAHACPACKEIYVPPAEQNRFYAAVLAKDEARST